MVVQPPFVLRGGPEKPDVFVRGYVQVDDFTNGNSWSKGPDVLRSEGYDVPDFSVTSISPSGRKARPQG